MLHVLIAGLKFRVRVNDNRQFARLSPMAKKKIFTQHELDEARKKLDEMPDISHNKISESEFIESLKAQIVSLAQTKGYDNAEIRNVLSEIGLIVTSKRIDEIINGSKASRRPRGSAQGKSSSTDPVSGS
ncbi:hypothetical protein K5D42_25090 [Pseudomonas cichorii]|nr:hypothetical protein [Pseudomonas cichorii]MBX8493149.1 hypothetical protein [Pseudomonas cichorii]